MPRAPKSNALLAWISVAGLLAAGMMTLIRGEIPPRPAPVSLLMVGDIMLGRGVAPVVAADPSGVFAGVRGVVGDADVAMGNLESPLTNRPHVSANPYSLEADPGSAALLSAAGFDVMALANNHAGDAGPASIIDTVDAVEAVGMVPSGAGSDLATARAPRWLQMEGVRLAVIAFDAGGGGPSAGPGPVVSSWDLAEAERVVTQATARADVVVVSLHGGVEYLPESDPRMTSIAESLVRWGADVVWGHGSHVAQPVTTMPGREGRSSVVATSLGNFLFDQRGPLTGGGAVLEVLADSTGVLAYRVGTTSHSDLRVRFLGWALPDGDAALVDGQWWALARPVEPATHRVVHLDGFEWGEVMSASRGRITGSGDLETVVSFRTEPGPHPVRDGLSDVLWVDRTGRSSHLGIYHSDDLTPIWVAGVVPAPIARVVACDGSLALSYTGLDSPEVVATGAAVWEPIGLDAADLLPGTGTPGCADVDGDTKSDPVVLRGG